MAVTIKPTSVILANLKLNPNGEAQRQFTQSCYNHMDKYVPFRPGSGLLRTIVDLKPDRIIYQSPYASYQYYGKRKDNTHVIKHWTTPGTGPYWNERMKKAEMKKIEKEVIKVIRRKK